VRLFIAIKISPEIQQAIAALLQEFRVLAPQIKWVRAENLHITLKFLGETPDQKLSPLQNALSGIRFDQSVNLVIHGLGFFPNDRRPKVLWAGMQASQNLQSLAANIDAEVHRLGFPNEERPFAPHLTLARLQSLRIPPNLLQTIHSKSAQNFGSLRTGEFHLIQSHLKPTGAEYTTLQSFRFAREA
jgi:RNA 2',3'-cyclic 3'-phosphodiesterase